MSLTKYLHNITVHTVIEILSQTHCRGTVTNNNILNLLLDWSLPQDDGPTQEDFWLQVLPRPPDII